MTEKEWLEGAEVKTMLTFLHEKASDRKLRLFAVACCRTNWDALTESDSRKAVEVAERFADNLASMDELSEAERDGLLAAYEVQNRGDEPHYAYAAKYAADMQPGAPTACSFLAASKVASIWYLRCIFGNPFRPVSVDPSWRTSNVTALAQAIYDEKAFDRLPILADALEDAGCDNQDILSHCRQPGEHVRGCWVVDLVLEKE
jgi:hypothetical protein